MNLKKEEIDRLGNKTRENIVGISYITVSELQTCRTSHKDELSTTFAILCAYTKKISPVSILIFHEKRFQSIIVKIERYPELRFSKLWNLGGIDA